MPILGNNTSSTSCQEKCKSYMYIQYETILRCTLGQYSDKFTWYANEIDPSQYIMNIYMLI